MANNIIYLLISLLLFVSCSNNSAGKGKITATGTIEATEINLSAKIGGQIDNLRLQEGDAVAPGDTLAVIDHSMPELQLKQARAGWELAQIQVESDRRDLQRATELMQKGSITQKQRDDAETRFKTSRARAEQALASVEIIRKNIADCYIVSPVRGVVTNANFEGGETVGPASVVYTISRLDTVEITVYIGERELGYVKIGQTAEVFSDSYPGRVYPGKVVYISSQAEFTPKNIQTKQDRVKQVFGVKIRLPNPGMELKPGMPADAAIVVEG
jgi:HlyD family secretion protein